jgi:hypothetical protein
MAICINIPQDAGNACKTASQMCGGASCSFTIVTSKFKPSGSKKKQTCCVKGSRVDSDGIYSCPRRVGFGGLASMGALGS